MEVLTYFTFTKDCVFIKVEVFEVLPHCRHLSPCEKFNTAQGAFLMTCIKNSKENTEEKMTDLRKGKFVCKILQYAKNSHKARPACVL